MTPLALRRTGTGRVELAPDYPAARAAAAAYEARQRAIIARSRPAIVRLVEWAVSQFPARILSPFPSRADTRAGEAASARPGPSFRGRP